MDEVITRILEIERQCTSDIEQTRLECEKNIEDRKRTLEEKISLERNQISVTENSRLTRAVEEAKKLTEDASAAFQRDCERPFDDPVLTETIKEDILSILLEG